MPKYYVKCGSLETVVDAPSHIFAAKKAVYQRGHGAHLGHKITIDERGFRPPHECQFEYKMNRLFPELGS